MCLGKGSGPENGLAFKKKNNPQLHKIGRQINIHDETLKETHMLSA